jgi:hypothetical protein
VDELLNSALDPVLDRACKSKEPETAVLALKICDRACGSGHFLVTAAKRTAKRLATIRSDEVEPSPEEIQGALRDVIAHCIYGVDSNPTAVELCKFSLWLESMDYGRPLSFLENRIKCGNSLLGATPAAIAAGIPDEAFAVLTGDDKTVVSALKKQNKKERKDIEQSQRFLFGEVLWTGWLEVREGVERIVAIDDNEISHVHQKQIEYDRLLVSDSYRDQKLIADAWCAAFVLPRIKGAPAVTAANFGEIKNNPNSCPESLQQEINRIAAEYQFFHWHLEFPEVYSLPKERETAENRLCGWNGGFDVNIGNPPWDRVKLQEKEWFAERVPEIAAAPNASKRKHMIEALKREQPFLFEQFQQALRRAEGESHLLRQSGLYPLCGRGDINLYAVFAEGMRRHLETYGLLGAVLPGGVATDDTTKEFFQNVIETRSLISLFDFENRQGFFPAVDSRMKFCLFTAGSGLTPLTDAATFVFFAHSTADLLDKQRRFTLTREDIGLLNPNTRTCAIFRSMHDAELTKAIYRKVPVLELDDQPDRNPWGTAFARMFDMTNDSELFLTREQLEVEGWTRDRNMFRRGEAAAVPLYEGRMIDHYDHRAASVGVSEENMFRSGITLATSKEQHADPNFAVLPRYWVALDEVLNRVPVSYRSRWFFGFKDVTSATNERTFICSIFPLTAVGNKIPIFLNKWSGNYICSFVANLSSLIFDFIARQKTGGVTLNFFIVKQLAALPPAVYATRLPGEELPGHLKVGFYLARSN